jgi:hypothetical protein
MLGMAGLAGGAQAAPVYVGLQDGNGAIATVINAPSGNGPFGFSITQIGLSGIYASGSVEGTPPLNEPDLLSTALTVSGEHDPAGGTVSIYVTELNQFPLTFTSYLSTFSNLFPALSTLGNGNQTANTVTQVVESTYVTSCLPVGANCQPLYAPGGANQYPEGILLSTTTFTSNAVTTVTEGAGRPNLTAPYAETEEYTITFAPASGVNTYGGVSSSIDVATPEPMSLALFGSALLGLGVVRQRRNKTV